MALQHIAPEFTVVPL